MWYSSTPECLALLAIRAKWLRAIPWVIATKCRVLDMCTSSFSFQEERRLGLGFYCCSKPERGCGRSGPWLFQAPGMIVVVTCMHSDQKLDPLAAVHKVCNPTPSRERLRDGHFLCSPCASPGVIAMTNARRPVNCSVCHRSLGSCTQTSLTFAERVTGGPVSPGATLEVVWQMYGSAIPSFRGSWRRGFLPSVWQYAWGGVYVENVSQPFLSVKVGVFSVT